MAKNRIIINGKTVNIDDSCIGTVFTADDNGKMTSPSMINFVPNGIQHGELAKALIYLVLSTLERMDAPKELGLAIAKILKEELSAKGGDSIGH